MIQSYTNYRGTTHKEVEKGYKAEQFKSVGIYLYMINEVLNEGKITRETDDSISVIIIKEKENSDLIDSTKVIVPKILYKQLKE